MLLPVGVRSPSSIASVAGPINTAVCIERRRRIAWATIVSSSRDSLVMSFAATHARGRTASVTAAGTDGIRRNKWCEDSVVGCRGGRATARPRHQSHGVCLGRSRAGRRTVPFPFFAPASCAQNTEHARGTGASAWSLDISALSIAAGAGIIPARRPLGL